MPTIQLDQGKTESRLHDRVTDIFQGRFGWLYSDNLAEKLGAEKKMRRWHGEKGLRTRKKEQWTEKNFTTKLHKFYYQGIGQNLRKTDVQINTKTI